MFLLRLSDWMYNMGVGGGVSVEFVMVMGGLLCLIDLMKQDYDYYYGGFGIGYGLGLKIFKIRFLKFIIFEIKLLFIGGCDVVVVGVGVYMFSGGWVYMIYVFQGKELSVNDFCGVIVYLDVFLLVIIGQVGDIMLMGIDLVMFVFGLFSFVLSMFVEEVIVNVLVLLIMYGCIYGFQVGFGVGLLVGYVY